MWVARVTSSANSMSRTRISDTSVCAKACNVEQFRQSVRVCRYTPSDDELKA